MVSKLYIAPGAIRRKLARLSAMSCLGGARGGGGWKLPFGDNVLLTQSFQVYRGWLGVPGNEAVTHVAYAAQPSSIKLAQSDHPLSSLPLQTWLP